MTVTKGNGKGKGNRNSNSSVVENKNNVKAPLNKKQKVESLSFEDDLDIEIDNNESSFEDEDEDDDLEDDEFEGLSDMSEHDKIQMFSGDEEEEEEQDDGNEQDSDLECDADLYSQSEDEQVEGNNENLLNINDDDDDDDQITEPLEDVDPASLSPTVLRDRIQSTLKVLSNWKDLSASLNPARSRSEVIAAWHADLAAYYSYSEYMVEKLAALFSCEEALQFFEANEQGRPVTLRVNTLKTRKRELVQALTARGVTVEPLGNWTPVGLQVFESPVPIGATPEYLAGQYLLQAGSSLLPVQALDPQVNDRVLDMSAAPGGKSTHLAALMRNTGILFANDSSKDRLKALIANIHRMGVRNSVVCNHDARKLPKILGHNSFQRILLDAPCSGTGVISKDPTVKASKTDADFDLLTRLQKELILAAADMCERGGFFVYSTCSVTVEENEEVVAYALAKRKDLRLVDTGIPFGREGFTAFRGKQFPHSLKLTRRFYPHMHNMDGFFVSKFEKIKQ